MSWDRWLLAAALVALGAVGATGMAPEGSPDDTTGTPSADETTGGPDVVLAQPSVLDRAAYTVTTGDGTEETTIFRSWNDTVYRLPDGSTRRLVTHQTASGQTLVEAHQADDPSLAWLSPIAPAASSDPVEPGRDDETEVATEVTVADVGYTQLPGNPAIDRLLFSFHTVGEGSETYRHGRDTQLRDGDTGCRGPIAAHLVERTPAEAEAVLQACAEERLDEREAEQVDVLVDSAWRTGERFEHVWRATVTVEANVDGQTHQRVTTLETSPSASLILKRGSQSQPSEGGSSPSRVIELDDWEPGSEAIPEPSGTLPEMPSVSAVTWSADGPSEGDLDLFPVADARADVQRTLEGATYFQQAEDPRFERARFVVQERDPGVLTATVNHNGTACQESAPANQAVPTEGDRVHWSLRWADPEEQRLRGLVTSTRSAQDNTLDRRAPAEKTAAARFDTSEFEDLRPAPQGPSLAELWSQRALADRFAEEGARTIGVQAGSPAQDGVRPLEGFVGRVHCDHASSNAEIIQETLVTFGEASATGIRETYQITLDDGQDDDGELPGYAGPLQLAR